MRIQLAQILLLDVCQFYLLVFKIINYTDVYDDKCKKSRISKLVDACAKLNRKKCLFTVTSYSIHEMNINEKWSTQTGNKVKH